MTSSINTRSLFIAESCKENNCKLIVCIYLQQQNFNKVYYVSLFACLWLIEYWPLADCMVAEKDTIRGTHRPRRVNPYPDVRFPTHEPLSRRSSCPDVRFPTRKSLSQRSFSRRVNLPRRVFPDAWTFPDVRFPDAWIPLPTCNFWCVKLWNCFDMW